MEKIKEMLKDLSYANLRQVEQEITNLKRVAKIDEKDSRDVKRQNVIDRVNLLIEDGTLTKGSKVSMLYRNKAVVAEIVTVPTTKSKNLRVESEEFDTKDGQRYAEKHTFLDFLD